MSNGNIERFLDYLVKVKGEKLVVGIKEPLYILRAGKKMPLRTSLLTEKEFQAVEAEYREIFSFREVITYKGTPIHSRRAAGQLEFLLPPGGAAPAPSAPPGTPAAPGTPGGGVPSTPPVQGRPVSPTAPPAAAAAGKAPAAPAQAAPAAPAPRPPSPPSPPPTAVPSAPSTPPPPSSPAAAPTAYSAETVLLTPVRGAEAGPGTKKQLDLDDLLRLMTQRNASDLHLSSQCQPALRIDGDMVKLEDYPLISSDEVYKAIEKITPQRNLHEFNETNDSDFAYSIEGLARFRANIFRDIHGVGAVFRIIPSKILTVEDLKVPQAMVNLCNIPKGLILVTGPTGSGKSTTLAALINHINENQRKHIITIEDPVEFVHANKKSVINQREVNTHTLSFKRALRAALREDPDIILVGEMRDLETIAIAIEMAVTGHLVFGTLHTSTAISTVDRIIDQFPADQQQQIRSMLADALIGVVAQSLLKKKAGGRIGGFEVLVVTPAVSNLIREGKTYQIATLMQTGKALGMQMINSHLTQLVEQGIVSVDEAVDKAIDKENLKSFLKGKGLMEGKL